MTLSEMNDIKGTQALWGISGVQVLVDVQDVRESFGRTDCLISPVGGSGEKWVQKGSLTFKGGGK